MMFVIVLFHFFSLQASEVVFEKREIQFSNQKKLNVELAQTPDQRYQGLMNRTVLKEGDGMLFIFDFPQVLSFWTKNTFIPLTIGYFDNKRVLKETFDMKAQSLVAKEQSIESYTSQCQCLYALEVPQGWFKKNKINIGTSFKFLPNKIKKNQ